MTKIKAKIEKKAKKSPAKRGPKKPVDLEGLRKQIHQLVGDNAVDLVNSTVSEAGKGHYPAMKYLFEIIGLYPSPSQEITAGDDSLARTLLRRLGLPEDPEVERTATKDMAATDADIVRDAVR